MSVYLLNLSIVVKNMKHCAADLQKRRPRDDGLTPQQLSKRFRFKARAMLQAAILRGNGLLAASVGV